MHSKRYLMAVERNLAELQRALLNRTAIQGIERLRGVTEPFLQISYLALFNDYIAHCIKVFETREQAASFWYVYRTNQAPIDAFVRKNGIGLESMRAVSVKLKKVRDKTHFHIDKTGVLDSKAVWRVAGLTGEQLAMTVDFAWAILADLQKQLGHVEVIIPADFTVAYVHEQAKAIEHGHFDS